jgi:hypothetical protein
MEVIIMRSRALAGVDGWLNQAEKVLEEQHERSVSPSSAAVWDAGEVERTITMADFAEGLEAVLRVISERPGRWIVIAESGPFRYWQALAYEDGALVAEVISNHWIDEHFRWTPEQENRLQNLGWICPDPPHRPNWSRVESTTSPDVAGVAQMAIDTLRQVFGLTEEDKLEVKQFSSPNRGSTPATPTYAAEQ